MRSEIIFKHENVLGLDHTNLLTVRPTVHTNSTLKQNFRKTLYKPEEFENTGCATSVPGEQFENKAHCSKAVTNKIIM